MSEALNTALMIMAVGMVTVFSTLLIVVLVGKLIIRFVNRFIPEAIAEKLPASKPATATAIEPNTLAVIMSAVNTATNGRAKVVAVEKK